MVLGYIPNISVLGLFQLFMTPVLVASIVENPCGNGYAHLVLGDARPWREITPEDIMGFLRLQYLMGINHLPALHHYWSTDPIFHYAPITETISLDRFYHTSTTQSLKEESCMYKYNCLSSIQIIIIESVRILHLRSYCLKIST